MCGRLAIHQPLQGQARKGLLLRAEWEFSLGRDLEVAFGAEELLCSGVGHTWVSEHVGSRID